MASNNLALGAKMLLEAGADPNFRGGSGDTPATVARGSRARDVLKVLEAAAARAPVPSAEFPNIALPSKLTCPGPVKSDSQVLRVGRLFVFFVLQYCVDT